MRTVEKQTGETLREEIREQIDFRPVADGSERDRLFLQGHPCRGEFSELVL